MLPWWAAARTHNRGRLVSLTTGALSGRIAGIQTAGAGSDAAALGGMASDHLAVEVFGGVPGIVYVHRCDEPVSVRQLQPPDDCLHLQTV